MKTAFAPRTLRRDGLPGGVRILSRNAQGRAVTGQCLLCEKVIASMTACVDEDFLSLMGDHLRRHEQSAARDLADLTWEVHATCTACERVGGISVVSGGALRCSECGTCWDMEGRDGVRSGE